RRREAVAGRRGSAAQVAHHAAHPRQRRRDPPARRALAGGPGQPDGRAPEDLALSPAAEQTVDTLPMPLDAVAAAHGGLDDFRLTSAGEIGAMLKRLLDGNVPLSLNAPDGSSLSATLWT